MKRKRLKQKVFTMFDHLFPPFFCFLELEFGLPFPVIVSDITWSARGDHSVGRSEASLPNDIIDPLAAIN